MTCRRISASYWNLITFYVSGHNSCRPVWTALAVLAHFRAVNEVKIETQGRTLSFESVDSVSLWGFFGGSQMPNTKQQADCLDFNQKSF